MDRDKMRKYRGTKAQGHKGTEDKGFTLVEVMIAMVILLIGMLGVMSMQYYSVSGNTASREMRVAINLSHELIEQMKATPYSNLAANTDNPPVGTAISGGVNFTRAWWVVSNCAGLGPSGNNTCAAAVPVCTSVPDGAVAVPASSAIRARTCWNDKDGTNHSVSMDTVRWDENVTP